MHITKTLSQPARDMVHAFQSLQIGNVTIPCLYYNNKHTQVRAGLRVSIGKGSPKELLEEVHILAQKDKLNLHTMDEAMIRMFLQKHNLGVDCSAFAYYVLDAELSHQTGTSLRSVLKHPYSRNPIRTLLTKLRAVENTNVKTLAHDTNSTVVPLSDVRPGDMITILEGGRDHMWYHVMIVHAVDYSDDEPTVIHYTHSYAWPSDGQYQHGVRAGHINIQDVRAPLLEQDWHEQNVSGENNPTWQRASSAKQVELRRLRGFDVEVLACGA